MDFDFSFYKKCSGCNIVKSTYKFTSTTNICKMCNIIKDIEAIRLKDITPVLLEALTVKQLLHLRKKFYNK